MHLYVLIIVYVIKSGVDEFWVWWTSSYNIYFLFFSDVILCTSNLFNKTIGQNLATDRASEAKSQPPKSVRCIAFAYILDAQRLKLDKKSDKLRYIGYIVKRPKDTGYLMRNIKSYNTKRCNI